MRALICEEFAPYDQLKVAEADAPPAGEGMVVIDVRAAGVNFPDILLVEGKYQMRPDTPFIPGMEIAGEVSEIGANVSGFKPGDRVIAATMLGGFAEKVAAPAAQIVPMPDSMSFEEGAALTTIYGTSYHALKQRADLKAGETLLVLGAAGGVGLAAVQIAKAMGATVIAAASSDEKLDVAKESGADAGINYASEDLKARAKELTDGKGVDVVYDPVGGDLAEPALRAVGWEGRYLVVGFAAGDIPKIPLNLALLNSRDIQGVFWGAWAGRNPRENAANMKALFDLYEAGKIKPRISAAYPLDDFKQAFDDIMQRRVMGKVVLTP
ncbi:NADPH:quinone oxidoreductase [Marinicauda salina]|uniref:NADPH:quinone oxidoreductase n=1 Tax=Marinicauda salina TaxID=2135793 RepID=A0A2U2BTS1_9PROT|nr:NADPH:quinone oxidoreductase family protein [Marinicauda salina]PWE17402.1 NADPH:quinone oxidoreductase [Marinicauda salina]